MTWDQTLLANCPKESREYISVKSVQAWTEVRDGKEGYAVLYPDGYRSWSPKEAFERSSLMIGRSEPGTAGIFPLPIIAEQLIAKSENVASGRKSMSGITTLTTGHEINTNASCVFPEQFVNSAGEEHCKSKARGEIINRIAFIIDWARNSLKFVEKDPPRDLLD